MATGLTEQLRERAKLTTQQREQERRQAVIDYVDGSTYSAEEWESRLQRLNWTVDDLERAGDRLAEHRAAQGKRAEGLAAAARLSEVQAELDAARKHFDDETARIRNEFAQTESRLKSEVAAGQAAMYRGNDADVWLREHLTGKHRDAVDDLQAQQRLLLERKKQIASEQAAAASFGTLTKERREQAERQTAQIDLELAQLTAKIQEIEATAIAL